MYVCACAVGASQRGITSSSSSRQYRIVVVGICDRENVLPSWLVGAHPVGSEAGEGVSGGVIG